MTGKTISTNKNLNKSRLFSAKSKQEIFKKNFSNSKKSLNFASKFDFGQKKKKFSNNKYNNYSKNSNQKENINPKDFFSKKFIAVLQFLTFPFVWIFRSFFLYLWKILGLWDFLVRFGFLLMFLAIVFQLAQLQLPAFAQVVGVSPFLKVLDPGEKVELPKNKIITTAKRGQIFIQNNGQNRENVNLTLTNKQTDIWFDPKNLKSISQKGLKIDQTALILSSYLNISYTQTLETFKKEIEVENPKQYVILQENISQDQSNLFNYLISSNLNKEYNFRLWLNVTERQNRSYPQNQLLASTLGYTLPKPVPVSEIEDRFTSCQNMVQKNREKGTDNNSYIVGSYGIEQKYCSELGGLNGDASDVKNGAVNGGDVYLTLDENIQKKAEEILAQAIKDNTNENGPPRNGTILVTNVKTGEIKGMATYPTFDPNSYQDYWDKNSPKYNPQAFINVATSDDYDIGSVMKPLTVASALNTYESNIIENGQRKGVSPNFSFVDYQSGKIYEETNGNKKYINNSQNISFRNFGTIGLKQIIRDSINTGIADVVDATGARALSSYYEDRFKFGKPTAVNLPGDNHGNIKNFQAEIGCAFCYANFGFGQGFTASPVQLVRAYTALANKGKMVEPFLVKKIAYEDGSIDDGTSLDSSLKKDAPRQIITENTARLVTEYMKAVVDEGYLGVEKTKFRVPGYSIAGKTGTSEVIRSYTQKDANGNPVLNQDGEPKQVFCDYVCNRQRGIYDHTFIGFGPISDPEYIVMIKISEPNRGKISNFSGNTVGPAFSQMMGYTLNYYNVPKDRTY
jgi:cell division protein FtsI/penicillin-binding protein 2